MSEKNNINATMPQSEAVEQLKYEISLVEAQEALLLDKIAQSKKLGLLIQAEQLRELLRRCLVNKARLNRTLMDVEIATSTADMDELGEEVEEVLNSELIEAALIPNEEEKPASVHKARKRALGYRIASRIIGFGGFLACLLGTIAYLVMTQVEVMNLPFEMLYLAVAGAGALFFILIGLILGFKAKALEREVAEIEEAKLIRMIEKSEACELAQIEAEVVGAAQKAEAKSASVINTKKMKAKVDGLVGKVKGNPKKTAKIAAACLTGVAIASVLASKGCKKSEGKTISFKID